MNKKGFWMIKDSEGNFVTTNRCFTLTDEGWLYHSYTGQTTGFIFYSNKDTAEKELRQLQKLNDKYRFGREFYLEYIEDLKAIGMGEGVFGKIA